MVRCGVVRCGPVWHPQRVFDLESDLRNIGGEGAISRPAPPFQQPPSCQQQAKAMQPPPGEGLGGGTLPGELGRSIEGEVEGESFESLSSGLPPAVVHSWMQPPPPRAGPSHALRAYRMALETWYKL